MDETVTIRQQFFFHAPDAHSVLLAGNFTDWQKVPIPLHKRQDGTWELQIDLSPGTYQYRFLVDGDWRDDPECTLRVANEYWSENMVRRVM